MRRLPRGKATPTQERELWSHKRSLAVRRAPCRFPLHLGNHHGAKHEAHAAHHGSAPLPLPLDSFCKGLVWPELYECSIGAQHRFTCDAEEPESRVPSRRRGFRLPLCGAISLQCSPGQYKSPLFRTAERSGDCDAHVGGKCPGFHVPLACFFISSPYAYTALLRTPDAN